MLLNEFLKEHRKVELQEYKAQEQQKEIDALKAELKEQKVLILGANSSAKWDFSWIPMVRKSFLKQMEKFQVVVVGDDGILRCGRGGFWASRA